MPAHQGTESKFPWVCSHLWYNLQKDSDSLTVGLICGILLSSALYCWKIQGKELTWPTFKYFIDNDTLLAQFLLCHHHPRHLFVSRSTNLALCRLWCRSLELLFHLVWWTQAIGASQSPKLQHWLEPELFLLAAKQVHHKYHLIFTLLRNSSIIYSCSWHT